MLDWKVGDFFVVKPEYRSMGRGKVPDPNGVDFVDTMCNDIVWEVISLCEGAHKISARSVDEWGISDGKWCFYFDKAWIERLDRDDIYDDGRGLIDA